MLVVTRLLPESPFGHETIAPGDVLVFCNKTRVSTLQELEAAWSKANQQDAPITFEMRDGSVATALRGDILQQDEKIEAIYNREYVGFHKTVPQCLTIESGPDTSHFRDRAVEDVEQGAAEDVSDVVIQAEEGTLEGDEEDFQKRLNPGASFIHEETISSSDGSVSDDESASLSTI